MKAEELRLGNYMMSAQGHVEVSQIYNSNNIGIKEGGNPYRVTEPACLIPIPLTEEWLLKFGFKKDEYTWYDLDNIGVNFDFKRMVYTTNDFEGNEVYNDIPFKEFVHSFQNLYFALTGKELELKNT